MEEAEDQVKEELLVDNYRYINKKAYQVLPENLSPFLITEDKRHSS